MDYKELEQAMADLDEDTVLDMMKEVMDNNGEGVKEALEACQKGMATVGDLFEKGEYFVGDLIYAGEIMVEAMDIIKPALAGADHKKLGRMILCTVKDDLHDIGKNIVKAMLEAGGFEAIDLGIDTINAFADAGMRDDVKIIIGGNPVSEEACKALGADEWAYSPQKTVQVCANWASAA